MAWKFIRRAHLRVWLAVAATLIPLGIMAGPAVAQTPVTCTYTVSSTWNGGFVANVDITNNGPAISGWTLRWTFTTPTADIQGWAAVITEQPGNQATATNMSWNGSIVTGETTAFGWSASAISTSVPADLTINGEPC